MNDQWTFLSNHGHVILFVAKFPDSTVREIASKVGITERATLKIISDLSQSGYILIKKNGRNNSYVIQSEKKLRHELEKKTSIKDFVSIVAKV